jgi:hypothetical protein
VSAAPLALRGVPFKGRDEPRHHDLNFGFSIFLLRGSSNNFFFFFFFVLTSSRFAVRSSLAQHTRTEITEKG